MPLLPEDDRQPFQQTQLGSPSLLPEHDETVIRLRAAMGVAAPKNPERSAEVFKLQTKTGLPAEIIERNFDEVKAEANRTGFDAEEFKAKSPLMAKWLASHPDHMAVAKDDLDNLSNIEAFTRALSRGIEIGRKQTWLGRMAYAEMTGDTRVSERVKSLEKEIEREPTGQGFMRQYVYRSSKILGQLFESIQQAGKTSAALGATGAAVGAGASLLAGPAAPALIAPAAAAGATAGMTVGAVAGLAEDAYRTEAGLAWLQMRKMKGPDGQEIDPLLQNGAAIFVGLANASLEVVGARMVAAPFIQSAKMLFADTARAALSRPTTASALMQFGKSWAGAVGGETATEIMQEGVNIFAEEVIKTVSDPRFKTIMRDPAEREAAIERLAQVAEETFKGMALLGVPGAGIRSAVEYRKAQEAADREQMYKALGTGIAGSKTFERLPEKMQEAIRSMTADGPIENLYLPIDTFTQYWQEQNVDPRDVAREMGISQQYEDAVASGTDIQVPTEIYATRLAPTEHNQYFAREVRRSPDEMNAREAEEFLNRVKEEQATQKAMEQEQEAPRAQISQEVAKQLEAAGFEKTAAASLSEQMAAFFATQSQRMGDVDPLGLFQKYGLKITREQASPQTSDQVLNQARLVAKDPQFVRAFGQSVTIDEEGNPRVYYHGTARDIYEWRPKQANALYVTPDPELAEDFTKYAMDYSQRHGIKDAAPVIYPLYVKAERPFDFQNQSHLEDFVKWAKKLGKVADERVRKEYAAKQLIGFYETLDQLVEKMAEGSWGAIEHPLVQEYIRSHAYDGFYTMEAGAKNLAVFNPEQLFNAMTGKQLKSDETQVLFQPAWHGSPHVFSKFSLKKIGTGEGAQVYGWGLYFTSKKEIAKWYRDRLSAKAGWRTTSKWNAVYSQLSSIGQEYMDAFLDQVQLDGDLDMAVEVQSQMVEEHNSNAELDNKLPMKDLRLLRKVFEHADDYVEEVGEPRLVIYGEDSVTIENSGELQGRKLTEPERAAMHALKDEKILGDLYKAIRRFHESVAGKEAMLARMDRGEEVVGITREALNRDIAAHQAIIRVLEQWQRHGAVEFIAAGRIYHVELPEPDNMLDWDKPFDQQPAKVQAVLAQLFGDRVHMNTERMHETLRDLYKTMKLVAQEPWMADWAKEYTAETIESMIQSDGVTSIIRIFKDYADKIGWETITKNSPALAKIIDTDLAILQDYRDDLRGQDFYGQLANMLTTEVANIYPEQGTRAIREWARANGYLVETPFGERIKEGTDPREVASRFLNSLGVHGIQYKGDTSGARNFVIFDDSLVNIISYEQSQRPGMQQDKARGFIRFGADRKFQIGVLENADLSTFIHESGHFYLEVLKDLWADLKTRDPGVLTDTQRQILADAETLSKWLGIEDLSKLEVKHHEQFARANEAYVMEGKAPSGALRAAFARFRAWLVALYRTVTNLNVRMNDDVREVFDRLYATDAEIEAVRTEGQLQPIFLTPEQAKMTPEQFEAYRKNVEEASRAAQEELTQRLMNEYRREQKAWWREAKAEVFDEVAREFNNKREYIAMAVLRSGELPGGEPLPEGMKPVKLDKAALEEMYGPFAESDVMKKLQRLGLYRDKGGVAPDVAAEAFGFKSGDEMVQALINLKPRTVAINEEVEARMLAKYGSMLLDGSFADKARQAVMNDAQAKVLHAELRALWAQARAAEPVVSVVQRQARRDRTMGLDVVRSSVAPLDLIRSVAQEQVRRTRVRDLQPHKYYVAARRFSIRAVDEATKGNYEEAANAKQRQLLNLELYREAMKAREEADDIVAYMRGLNSPRVQQRLGKAGPGYLDQIQMFLHRFDFARVSLRDSDKRMSLARWIEEQEKQGFTVDLPADIINEAFRKPWKEMTYEELLGVRDAARHVMHLAKLKNKLLKVQDQREFDVIKDEIVQSVKKNARHDPKSHKETRLPQDEVVRGISGFFASHRKLASIVRELDGFNDGGPVWNYLMRELNRAGTREASMHAEASKKLKKIFAAYDTKALLNMYRKVYIPEINDSLSRQAILMVALNWGNEDNRQKLMDGYGWGPNQVNAILSRLDKRDWEFVQNIWDFINEFWPEIEAKQRRVTGVAPQKVEASPVQTPFGEFRGGYFPLKYDDRQSPRAFGNRVKEAARLTELGGFVRSTTRRGHTIERIEGVKMQVRLDFGVILEHTHQVIHDLTHHEVLIDANRLVGSRDFSRAVIDHFGDQVYDQMRSALQDIAAGNIPAQSQLEHAMNWIRHGTSIAAMGWNLMTGFMQFLGLSQSIVRIGAVNVAKGLGHWLGDAAQMQNSVKWIHSKSEFMRTRHDTMMREVNEIRNAVRVRGKLSPIEDSYFWLITRMQMVVDIPTWLGAYEKFMAEHGDEAKAIDQADSMVLESQAGGQIKDLARVQRGGPLLKLWTNFYSYFNVTFNLTAESFRRTNFRHPAEVGRFAVDMVLLYVVPSVLATLIKEAIKGDTDDKDELVEKIVREQISYMLGTVLLARELSGAIQGFYGYEGPAGARLFAELGQLARQLEQGEVDEALLKSLNNAAGILFHYPAGQVQRTVEGYVAISEGRTDNPLALIFGPRKEDK